MEELLTDEELEEMRLAALAEDERARAPPPERAPPRHAPATPPPPARPPAPPGFDVDQLFADSDDALGLARPAPARAGLGGLKLAAGVKRALRHLRCLGLLGFCGSCRRVRA